MIKSMKIKEIKYKIINTEITLSRFVTCFTHLKSNIKIKRNINFNYYYYYYQHVKIILLKKHMQIVSELNQQKRKIYYTNSRLIWFKGQVYLLLCIFIFLSLYLLFKMKKYNRFNFYLFTY